MDLKEAAKPRGKDETKAALLSAANELFGLKGPDSVSVRDVAAHAGVNHALLHRHFGSKESLLREVLLDHAIVFREAASAAPDSALAAVEMAAIAAARPAFTKILAQLLISGHLPNEFALEDGGVSRLTKRRTEENEGGEGLNNAQLEVAHAMALMFGWTLFSPFLLYATGFKGTESEANDFINMAIENTLI
ncbi:TetR/AcrR family transcriptional regulator [Pseudomonas gingeri]|uniref:TetR/AcrR family transcriptional regulator n=1 Tax=Pseudomonas gingeri TaxID=117681 RepID=UPI003527BC83